MGVALEPLEAILFLLMGLLGVALYVASIVWAYRDAERRGKSGPLVALLVALIAWPLGVVVWLLVRPGV